MVEKFQRCGGLEIVGISFYDPIDSSAIHQNAGGGEKSLPPALLDPVEAFFQHLIS